MSKNTNELILFGALTGVCSISYAAINTYQGGAGPVGSITVSATVADACAISIPDLNFGTYDPNTGSALTKEASIDYECTSEAVPTLSFSVATLEMTGPGSDVIAYTLHEGSGASGTQWTSSSNYSLPTANGTSQSALYSGSIETGQFVQPGNYSQDLRVTLSF